MSCIATPPEVPRNPFPGVSDATPLPTRPCSLARVPGNASAAPRRPGRGCPGPDVGRPRPPTKPRPPAVTFFDFSLLTFYFLPMTPTLLDRFCRYVRVHTE